MPTDYKKNYIRIVHNNWLIYCKMNIITDIKHAIFD